ncbi:MAG: hypothetical protein KBG15_22270 [Kofleriaceae bacterium]|nr:hypothetical protein [Kofleriaceae bacterium]
MVAAFGCRTPQRYDTRPVVRPPVPVAVVAEPDRKLNHAPPPVPQLRPAEQRWQLRTDANNVLAAIELWQKDVVAAPLDVPVYERIAQACYFLVTTLDATQGARDRLALGMQFAERGMRVLSPAFEKARQGDASVEDASKLLDKQGTALLYWYAVNVSRWAALGTLLDKMREMPMALRLMERIEAVAPTLDHAGPARWLGAYYANAPGIAGGDVKKGRQAFERAIALAPTYLETRVHFAELYARPVGDAALWQAQLQTVVAATLAPDAAAEQRLAQTRARKLLAAGFSKN